MEYSISGWSLNSPHHIQNSQDIAKKVFHLKLQPEETMVSYDVISLFKCIPTTAISWTITFQKEQPYHRPKSAPCWTSD